MKTTTLKIRVLETKPEVGDHSANFPVEYKGYNGRLCRTEAYVFDARDCRQDPGVFIMQRSACLKSHYSTEDIMHQHEMNTQPAVLHGDIVEFAGELFTVKILGNYSDMGRLIPLAK